MIVLEDAIEDKIENDTILRHVYSRTGNNIKDLVYHIRDQAVFLTIFNNALTKHKNIQSKLPFLRIKIGKILKRC